MRAFRIVFLVTAAFATAAAAATAFTPLGLRPGLWHVTVQMTGTMPIPASALSRMPAEQRAKMLAQMQKPLDTKQCLTAEQLAKGFDVGSHGEHCSRTVLASSAAGFKMQMECKTERGTLVSGIFALALVDATHFRGSTAMTMTVQSKTNNMGSNVVGEWVSTDCGHVKPGEPE